MKNCEKFENYSVILIQLHIYPYGDLKSFAELPYINNEQVLKNFFSLTTMKVTFRTNYGVGHIVNIGLREKNYTGKATSKGTDTTVQCFPVYSILLAVNRTAVDYFSLDIEGHELLVLQTIPFSKVDIKVGK